MTLLRPIAPDEVPRLWDWVREGLMYVLAKGKEKWLPEDVYMALRTGAAVLYAIEKEAEDLGFLVLQRLTEPDGVTLFVWAGWTQPMALLRNRDDVAEALDALARSAGAKRIRHHSARDGWEFADYFRVTHKVFEREV